MKRYPVITLAWVAAAIVGSLPEAAAALVYDRQQILSGELWRITTGNCVHFSKSHFAYDVLAFALAGGLIESRGYRGFGRFSLQAPVVIGLMVFLGQPELELFGGLSGMATGATVFLCLQGLCESGPWRWICLLALTAIAVKTSLEFVTGQMVFAHSNAITIKPVPLSHVAGALAALLSFFRSAKGSRHNSLGRERAVIV